MSFVRMDCDDMYYIENAKMYGYNIVADFPEVRGNRIGWRDTSGDRGDVITAQKIEFIIENDPANNGPAPAKIVVHVNENSTLTLHKLTVQVYNDHVQKRIEGAPTFTEKGKIRAHLLER